MKPEELFELVERVDSKKSFLAFVHALEQDFELSREEERRNPTQSEPAARGWYTATIGDFLESMRAWSTDNHISEQASWRLFAEMLHNGKLYE